MTNIPILPIVPNGSAPVGPHTGDDEDKLQTNNAELDDGETTDSQKTVDDDVREATTINDNLEK